MGCNMYEKWASEVNNSACDFKEKKKKASENSLLVTKLF